MPVGSVRTSLFVELLSATAVADTNKHTITETVEATGNSMYLGVVATNILNTVTITAEISPDGTSWYAHSGSWEAEVTAAGSYLVHLTGINTTPQDLVRISYQCETAAGTIAISARSWENAGGSGGDVSVGDVEVGDGLATEATLGAIQTAVELLDNAVDGAEIQVDVVSSALPTGAATEATLGAIQTAVELLDNAVDGAEIQVDVVSSALPTGAATEATLGAIQTAVELLDNAVDGDEIQVDVVSSALPTGAATEATLGAIQTAVELIDDVVGTEDAAVGTKGLQIVGESRTSQKSAMSASGDVCRVVLNANGEMVIAGYDWDASATLFLDADPPQNNNTYVPLVAVTNGTDGTYLYHIDLKNYPDGLSLQGIIDGGSGTCTVTLELTVEDNDTPASAVYDDVTQYGFSNATGAAAASYTDDFIVFLVPGLHGRHVKVKVVANTSGSNDADWIIHAVKK